MIQWIIRLITEFKSWFDSLQNADKIATASLVISAITFVTLLISKIFMFFKWIFLKKYRDARIQLTRHMKVQVREIKNESIFFHEIQYRPRAFFHHPPISYYNNDNAESDSFIRVRQLKKAFLLIGEAGCGKSAILKQHFLIQSRKKHLFKSACCLFMDSDKIMDYLNNNNKKTELYNILKQSKFKHLYLYLDGIDEIGNENAAALFKMIEELHSEILNVSLKVSCRTAFASRHIFQDRVQSCFDKIYEIKIWNPHQLQQFSYKLLHEMKKKIAHKKYNDVLQYIENAENWKEHINSPLLIKLLLYIKLFSDEDVSKNIANKYTFYTQFLTVLVYCYEDQTQNQRHPLGNIDSDLNRTAEEVFQAYCHARKYISKIDVLESILKPIYNRNTDGKSIFCHETFFEYFVARYYYMQITKTMIDEGAIKALSQNYSNDFADFISAALTSNKTEESRLTLAKRFIDIYSLTLTVAVKKQYGQADKESHILRKAEFAVSRLYPQHFFSLKYEIIFRLGRLKLFSDMILDFLEFVYYYDTNTRQVENTPYYIAVLRRCCAISSSFMGGEKIELDYVSHMLPFYQDAYDRNYDIANRSHTLLFYGDVPNDTIFSFHDEHGYVKWDHARKKRIQRLSTELPSAIQSMNPKQKKQFYFRLFDLATIYTFLYSRPSHHLTTKEINIIKNCKIEFSDQSTSRANLLRDIKEHTLLRIKNFNSANI